MESHEKKNKNTPLLEVRGLKTYFFMEEGTVRAVDGVDLSVRRGETLGVVGESGCGKSVTARSIMNMVQRPGKIVSGSILYDFPTGGSDGFDEIIDIAALSPKGSEIRRIRWNEIAMIFQEPMTSFSPVHTIGSQIVEAITWNLGLTKREAFKLGVEMLTSVGLPRPHSVMSSYRHQLSGGMRQRAMIAIALVCHPALLIADEPTTAVDVTTQAQILDLMRNLQDKYQMAMIFITHDLGVIAEIADQVMVMYLGKNVELADVDTLYYHPAHPYTRALLRSIPRVDGKVDELNVIKGSVPSPYTIPKGCAFHSRCQHYVPGVCDTGDIDMIQVGESHWVRCVRIHEIDNSFLPYPEREQALEAV